MNRMELQQSSIIHLLKLVQENPDLEIIPMVDSAVVFNDDHCYWAGSWGRASIDEYWVDDERIYFRSEDEDDLIENEVDNIYELYDESTTDKELEEIAKEKINKYNWQKAIIVRINTV